MEKRFSTPSESTGTGKAPLHRDALFRSFWMGGFEGADDINSQGCPLSMNEANQHWQQLESDYALLAGFGIRTVRESIGWRVTELQGEAGELDFRRLQLHVECAARHGVEVIWTLMHYGWPADIDLLPPAFVERFAAFSERVARMLRIVLCAMRLY